MWDFVVAFTSVGLSLCATASAPYKRFPLNSILGLIFLLLFFALWERLKMAKDADAFPTGFCFQTVAGYVVLAHLYCLF